MSSSHTSERNKKFWKVPPAQRAAAALARHTGMAQKLFNYVQTHDIKKSTIKQSTLMNKKVYHDLLNDNKYTNATISKSVYEIFLKM